MSQLVKDIFMWFGIVTACVTLVASIYYLACDVVNNFKSRVIKDVIDSLRIENCGMPNASKLPDRNVPMTLDGEWVTVNIENYMESCLKRKGLIKEE